MAHAAFIILFPPLAGVIIGYSAVKLLGKSDVALMGVISMAAAVGVGFCISLLGH